MAECEGTIDVAIFLDYGSSQKAEEFYTERTGKENPNRHDPEFIESVRVLGKREGENGFDEFCNDVTSVHIHQIPREMKDFYIIKDSDGFESLILLYSKKAFSDIEEIMANSFTGSEEKIILIKEILKGEKIDRAIKETEKIESY